VSREGVFCEGGMGGGVSEGKEGRKEGHAREGGVCVRGRGGGKASGQSGVTDRWVAGDGGGIGGGGGGAESPLLSYVLAWGRRTQVIGGTWF